MQLGGVLFSSKLEDFDNCKLAVPNYLLPCKTRLGIITVVNAISHFLDGNSLIMVDETKVDFTVESDMKSSIGRDVILLQLIGGDVSHKQTRIIGAVEPKKGRKCALLLSSPICASPAKSN
ncbi:hypothetical protein J6590_000110 [Homalodisca vitripennis]|nr:hypothetical protein J6590_000110 [Homalodisca vitripennis]